MNRSIKAITRLILLLFLSSGSAFVTVGPAADNNCDYHNLEDAYNDADAFVRVTSNKTVNPNFTFTKTKWITGGYSSCASATAGDSPNGTTHWLAPFNNMTTVDINAPDGSNSLIVLDRFDIYGGVNTAEFETGGIKVRGDVTLTLSNSLIRDHESHFGGGIQISGSDVSVLVINTVIKDNTSIYAGGGVSCTNSAQFTLMQNSSIRNNEALGSPDLNLEPGHGGGLYAHSLCQASLLSGDNNDLFSVDYGVISNTAQGQGGGVYIAGGANVDLTGNRNHPASIIGNIANIDTSNVIIGGGGIYIQGDGNLPSDGSSFRATNGRIEFNTAKHAGAGFGVTSGGTFTMKRAEGRCWDNDKCSSLSLNFVTDATGNAAAGYIYDVSTASISGTYISQNNANEAALFELNHVGYLKLEGNLIINNGPLGQPFASELIDITGNNSFASNLDFSYNTVAENNVAKHFYLHGSSQQWLRIYNSIITDQGDILAINTGNIDPDLIINCNYVHEMDSISNATSAQPNFNQDNFNLDPDFVNPGNGDYHLSPNSLAKDLCNNNQAQGQFTDLNGHTRGYDDPNVVDLRGPYDAGAYEDISADLIFFNSFD
ncbi:MAG: hypothetical protein OQK49_07745 [Proteobacteria bacterium]|nr:hypothetical protein [Pseudomonadota bacterium]